MLTAGMFVADNMRQADTVRTVLDEGLVRIS